MQRYFVPVEQIKDDVVTIKDSDYHHIAKVLRMTDGEEVICVLGDKGSALVRIENITNEEVLGTVIEWLNEEKELPVQVTIVSGLPKGDKLEYIVQKGTELGAHFFIPFIADRSIVKWDAKKAAKKVERLQKIAKEAAEQSHRTVVPQVETPLNLRQLLERAKEFDVLLVAYEEEAKKNESSALSKALQTMKPGASVIVVFGPEGGLTELEVEALRDAGFTACGLGPRILRTETAPLYVLSAVSYQLELMG
ncbi:16S rRNA (uracil(1498)-N(3))-methyltransferase [Bacillus massiliigorillae]|uniref:16S rRNA (uracil(1498)-N(3))-methyltransferase n=1 Tax=Bacillus massiliigorillae TaxID=1243664 RepID=UPI0003A5A1B5|nr:16S rRNA (uracil(1498)-N(3))-methyltransferase [Bacillus massiliigorillae]